jgi:hypothetical protein
MGRRTSRVTRNNGHARRGGGKLIFLANRQANGNGQKLTLAQRDQVLDWLGRGWPPSKVRDALREAGGPSIALPTVVGYQKRHAEEIAQKRQAWMAKLRNEPMAQIRDRIRELARMYGRNVAAQFRELCPSCGGEGTLPALRRPVNAQGRAERTAEPLLERTRCETCLGRKWIIPAQVQAMLDTLGGDIRFDTLPQQPPALDPEGMNACLDILDRIRKEVGDAWSPREQAATPDSVVVGGDVNTVVLSGSKEEYIAKLRQLRGAPATGSSSGSSPSAPASSAA